MNRSSLCLWKTGGRRKRETPPGRAGRLASEGRERQFCLDKGLRRCLPVLRHRTYNDDAPKMPIGRLMTFAVRQALAEATRAAEASQASVLRVTDSATPDHEATTKGDDHSEDGLIPCAAPVASTSQVKVNGKAANGRRQRKRKRAAEDEGSKLVDDNPTVEWTLDTMPEDLVKCRQNCRRVLIHC